MSCCRLMDRLMDNCDGAHDGLGVEQTGGLVSDEVDVGVFLTGFAVLGSIPSLGEAVESAYPVAPTLIDADGHLRDVAAGNSELVVATLEGGECVGCPYLGSATGVDEAHVDDAVATMLCLQHDVVAVAWVVGLPIGSYMLFVFFEQDGFVAMVAGVLL